MLDALLGRKELKEQIAELQAERDSLEEQLAAEQRRRRDAVSDRQDAEERVNRLEDRIAELQDRVDRLDTDDDTTLPSGTSEPLRGTRLTTVLDRLESVDAPPEGAITAALTDTVPAPIEDVLGDRTPLLARSAPCLACIDDAGLVRVALEPPVQPPDFCERGAGFALDRSWFEPTDRFGLALVRSDVFAVGVYEGRDRVDVRGFQTDVKSNHSKGGFSQGRFERIREGQIADHLDRAHDAIDEVDVDRLFVVGTAEHLEEFADRATATAAVDATGDPEAALEDAFQAYWTTRLTPL
ncbi:MAG: Vms1/Ankzf1 family peptidyl-tRNA hydrolase [Halobacteriaceae archaeon]